jgi:diguanylate cyclase (GGDEF)-like protein
MDGMGGNFLIQERADDVLGSLAEALDLVDFGIVLLNRDFRARFINRAFAEIWQVPQSLLATGPSFRALLEHGARSGWYTVAAEEMPAYLDFREAAIRAGAIPPTEIALADGRSLLFRCVLCPDGGRILTYADITELKRGEALMRQARDAAERAGLELQSSNQSLESQAAYLLSLAEASERAAAEAEQARRQLEREIEERRELEAQLRRMATIDGLTGALNRTQIMALGAREIERARRLGSEAGLAVLLLDIDHFKQINDRYSHFAGDAALQHLVAVITRLVRRIDLLGRFGGEEFVLVLPAVTQAAALQAAERIRAGLADSPVLFGERQIPLTVSIGLSMLRREDSGIEPVLARADIAVYAAKAAGRNRVMASDPD